MIYIYFLSSDSFGGLQASGGRGLGLSRVSQQDLDLVRYFFLAFTQSYIFSLNLLLISSNPPVCARAVEKRHGRRIRRGSAEEAPRGGELVQPGPLPLHLHPGPRPQDPRPAPAAQELRRTQTFTRP